MSTRLRCAALLLLGALATACATDSGSTDAGVDPTVEPTSATPAPEDTGHEKPAPTVNKKKVDLVGGPVGDNGETTNDDGTVCQSVAWLGGEDGANLENGITFRVTKIGLKGATRAGAGCSDDDSCDGFTFTDNGDNCVVAVHPGKSVGTLTIRGEVRCRAAAQECREFRSNLTTRTISIEPAPDVEPSEDEEPPDDEEPGPETSNPEQPPAE